METTTRASWDEYFLEIARTTATRATCMARQHGAVIVRDRRIVATGYDGGPSGYPHCDEGGCPRAASVTAGTVDDDAACIAIHAEANALLFSTPEERDGATLYGTGAPCFACAKLIANSGVREVVARDRYEGWTAVRDFLRDCGVRVRLLERDERAGVTTA